MKVLFITHCTAMAGANRSMLQLILELRENYGIEPFVLLPQDEYSPKTLKHYLQSEGIRYLECEIPFFKQPSINLWSRLYYKHCLDEILKVCETLRQENFQIVHSNSSVLDFGGYISRILGVRHIWHLRDFGDLDYGLYSIWGKKYERLTYKNGEAYIAISNVIKKHFSRVIPEEKIFTIYNGIKPQERVPLADHSRDIIQFLCAGVISPAKNQFVIVKAVKLLIQDRGVQNLHLTLVGKGSGEYLETMKRYVIEQNLSDYVTFMGEVDGIETLAATMDVGIMSSNCEAFGRVTVEYMLQNLAVIANDRGANKEIVKDGETGLIYKHGFVEDLANKMQVLIQNRELLISLSNNGRTHALEHFLSNQNSDAIYSLYNQLLNNPSFPPLNPKSLSSYRLLLKIHYMDRIHRKIHNVKHRINSYLKLQ